MFPTRRAGKNTFGERGEGSFSGKRHFPERSGREKRRGRVKPQKARGGRKSLLRSCDLDRRDRFISGASTQGGNITVSRKEDSFDTKGRTSFPYMKEKKGGRSSS